MSSKRLCRNHLVKCRHLFFLAGASSAQITATLWQLCSCVLVQNKMFSAYSSKGRCLLPFPLPCRCVSSIIRISSFWYMSQKRIQLAHVHLCGPRGQHTIFCLSDSTMLCWEMWADARAELRFVAWLIPSALPSLLGLGVSAGVWDPHRSSLSDRALKYRAGVGRGQMREPAKSAVLSIFSLKVPLHFFSKCTSTLVIFSWGAMKFPKFVCVGGKEKGGWEPWAKGWEGWEITELD